MGPVLHRLLNDLGEQHSSVGEVRSIGLFGVIELVRDRKTKEPLAPWNSSSPEMNTLRKQLLEKGLFLIHPLAHLIDHPTSHHHRRTAPGRFHHTGCRFIESLINQSEENDPFRIHSWTCLPYHHPSIAHPLPRAV